MGFLEVLSHAWNALNDKQPPIDYFNTGPSYAYRPDRTRLTLGNERSIISSVYTRIGIDVASVPLYHVKVDQNGRYQDTIKSGLNNCLTVEANLDQTGRAFIQDVVMSMCDEGVIAIVPIDTTFDPNVTNSYDILSMRTAKIIEWMPEHVRVNVYNDRTGRHVDLLIEKRRVAIVENPFYSVMNELNSTFKRLIHKLNLLDSVDDQSGSGKLDLLITLPYAVKTPTRIAQAEKRREKIEQQLAGSKYGIAYIDGTEKVTQLNRPAENNLMKQVEYLTSMLYSQLGMTQEVFDGTADEATMLNYYSRTIEPILATIAGAMDRAFITKTARSQGQRIKYFRNVFSLVPAKDVAEMSDSLTRNEIVSSNEMRDVLGLRPSKEKGADELRNKNLNPVEQTPLPQKPEEKKLKGEINET